MKNILKLIILIAATMTSYIDVSNEYPFAVIALPGTVTATGNIVMKFNKAVDMENGYIYGNRYFTPTWSSDKKTVTLSPTDTWGNVGQQVNIWFHLYTPDSGGGRENISRDFYVRIVE